MTASSGLASQSPSMYTAGFKCTCAIRSARLIQAPAERDVSPERNRVRIHQLRAVLVVERHGEAADRGRLRRLDGEPDLERAVRVRLAAGFDGIAHVLRGREPRLAVAAPFSVGEIDRGAGESVRAGAGEVLADDGVRRTHRLEACRLEQQARGCRAAAPRPCCGSRTARCVRRARRLPSCRDTSSGTPRRRRRAPRRRCRSRARGAPPRRTRAARTCRSSSA